MICQRNPVTLPPLTDFEREYHRYNQFLEKEASRGQLRFSLADSTQQMLESHSEASTVDDVEKLTTRTKAQYQQLEKDLTSLKRSLDRKLYLVLRIDGAWRFPYCLFDKSANSSIDETIRVNFTKNAPELSLYWVGKAPVAVRGVESGGDFREFFFRAQVLSSKAASAFGTEFGWLKKEEIERVVTPSYYESVRDVLSA